MKRYAKHLSNGSWVLSISLARQVLALAFLMVLVRAFEKEAVGQFQFVIAAVGIAGIFTLSGLGQAVMQSVARGHPGTFRTTLKWRLAGSVVGSAAIAIYTMLLPEGDPMRPALIAAALLFPLAHGLSGWTDVQAGEGKFKLNAIWQGAEYLLSYGGMMLALWLGTPDILLLVLIMKMVLAIVNLAAVRTILRRIPFDAPAEPGALRYGLQMSLWGVANTLGSHIDKVLVFTYLSPAELAVFVIAERIPEIMKKYVGSALDVLKPSFARRAAYDGALDSIVFKVNMLYWAFLAAVILIIPLIFPIIFSASYDDAILLSQLLCATLALGPASQFRLAFIHSKLDAHSAKNITVYSNAIRIVFSFIFVSTIGLYGAVASVALSRIAAAVLINREITKLKAK